MASLPFESMTSRKEILSARLAVVHLLEKSGIMTCLWAEDALAFYSAPLVLFELYLLVPDDDLEKASAVVRSQPGYEHVPPDDFEMTLNLHREYFLRYWDHRYLPSGSDTGVQLLPSREFAHFDISPETTVTRADGLRFPKLGNFIESLVYQFFRLAPTNTELAFRSFVQLHIAYLGSFAPDRQLVLGSLSPIARRLWSDILIGIFDLGESGRSRYLGNDVFDS
jgi:hypothetical protein